MSALYNISSSTATRNEVAGRPGRGCARPVGRMEAEKLTDACFNEADLTTKLALYERYFADQDIEAILEGFDEGITFHYGQTGAGTGKDALRHLLERRFKHIKNYNISKTLERFGDDWFAASWTADWLDERDGTRMRGFGLEILQSRKGLFVDWKASFEHWPDETWG